MTHLGIQLTKYIKELGTENHNAFKEEIKENLNTWRNSSFHALQDSILWR